MKDLITDRKRVLAPIKGSQWASEMVLNPTIIEDGNRIHMLFRATGPYGHKQIEGKPVPYPIFLGYGYSEDGGDNWIFDNEKPAICPTLEYDQDKIYTYNAKGEKVVNYANGCIEDPRIFRFEGECYLTVACRLFPPGPYWINDEPMQCAPDWANGMQNNTVNLLYKVNLAKLSMQKYEQTFEFITQLSDPKYGEDRDVLFFPERINGKIAMLQRPFSPENYEFNESKPSIVIAYADSFYDFVCDNCKRYILETPKYIWEGNRIGASCVPIKMENGDWLLNYHAKQDEVEGYTQSFMILKETENGIKVVSHPDKRMILPSERWEQPSKFKTPCLFFAGLIKYENKLLVSYGAADEFVGVMKIDYNLLINYLYGSEDC